jgi:hypothetical protein
MNPETRAKARELFDLGVSRNAIARTLDLDPATVTRWAAAEGVEFDRAPTALAVRAHTIDLAKDRLALTREMMVVAREGLAELDDSFTVYNFGGKDNTFAEHTFDRPPPDVRRQALTSAGIAFDKATKVLEKTNEGIGRAESLVDHLEQFFDAQPDDDGD